MIASADICSPSKTNTGVWTIDTPQQRFDAALHGDFPKLRATLLLVPAPGRPAAPTPKRPGRKTKLTDC
jgi:hypothetical protein